MIAGSAAWYCFRAWPTPATLPCPKIPNVPGISRSRYSWFPTVSTVYCLDRNSTTAWATVILRVAVIFPMGLFRYFHWRLQQRCLQERCLQVRCLQQRGGGGDGPGHVSVLRI